MNITELNKEYSKINRLIYDNRIVESFSFLQTLCKQCSNSDYLVQVENQLDTYTNILKYSFDFGEDPEREKIYKKLVRSVIEINDLAREDILRKNKLLSYVPAKNQVMAQRLLEVDKNEELIGQLTFDKELNELLKEASGIERIRSAQDYLRQIFEALWLTDHYGENENDFVRKIISDQQVTWYEKSLFVSAVTLSLMRFFDLNKLNLLFDFVSKKEPQIWQRALIGIVLCMAIYDERIYYYPEITNRMQTINGDKDIEKAVEMIIIQFIRSKDTEKVTKRIQEELLPEMLKMRSHIEEKLDLDNIISADAMEEKNPEWKRMFEDTPGLYDKMEEFSNLQQEGADVFLGAFSMLKFFDFFQDLYAWFLPFYKENPVIKDAFEGLAANSNTDSLLEGIESTGFMCNSDKYSFCLNVKNLPQQQKDMLSNMFNMELKAMNEMREDEELINSSSKDKFIITQYFQDLYRFFKLHPKKYEFFDVFKLKSTLHKTTFFDVLVNDKNVLRNIGEFYFEKEHYEEAISIFKELIEVQESFELFEKIGYSYQMMGDYQRALKYYKNAELFDKNREWILKKIAYCYRKLQNYDRALEYYKEAEKLDPENMYTQTFMGNVHVDRKEYEEALKYYFKVEYMAKDNYRVHRPISWCSFMLGKLDTAEKYLVKVIEKGANKHDYMNMGHIKWCMGDKKGAIENYKQSLEKSKKDFKWFAKTINIDRPHLLNNNIDPLEIPLMIDYLRVNA